jgi:hypothetical protein
MYYSTGWGLHLNFARYGCTWDKILIFKKKNRIRKLNYRGVKSMHNELPLIRGKGGTRGTLEADIFD